ncbi:hypothetical protein EK21DRAFT_111203 [Setomelanomma holmii]|uniref:Utp8 beta-propeller domain-containing protein n=1 Tax=Setomelanomma holmii TaxID=210430 RepID=A0A9P4HCF9_9PLEO|nr:hypothetical protein EK21DRAFT_111203 [Setomelanomma holmii]
MSFSHEIGAPFTLATLPKPVGSTNGRAHAAGVCSITGIKKRKRTEIAVGLDGEGISIYSLQNPQLVTSYALPPSARFTIAPCSVYRKGSSRSQSQRFTYAAVTGSTQNDKLQVHCFRENLQGDKSEIAKTAYTPSNNARILALEILPVGAGGSATSATHDLLATFDNGDVICLSSDLGVVRWTASLKPWLSGDSVEHVSTATAKAVSRGLLRHREDIAAGWSSLSDDRSDILDLTQVLCVVSRKSNGVGALHLVQAQTRSQDLNTGQLSPLKHLVSWNLPTAAQSSRQLPLSAQYVLHASSGSLYILTGTTLLSFDFSDTVPRLYSNLALPKPGADSFLRLAQDIVFTTSGLTCRIFDTKFNSLQACQHFDAGSSTLDTASPAKKRKFTEGRTETKGPGQPHLVAYYAEQDLVVVVSGNEMSGLQLRSDSNHKRTKAAGTSLADALGKGLAPQSKGQSQDWNERRAKLNKYASKGKIDKFEGAFAADLGIALEPPEPQAKLENEVNGGPLTNGVGPKIPEEDAIAIDFDNKDTVKDNLRTWKMPSAVNNARKIQSRRYALYALSRIFRLARVGKKTSGIEHRLQIQFFPPNVFHWLLHTGHLTVGSLRHALLEEAAHGTQEVPQIDDGDIVNAIVDFDPELHILSAVLNDGGHLIAGEVVQAIRLLMQNLDDEPEADETPKLLTNGTAPSEDEMDVDIASELEAADHEIDHALSVLDHGLLIRSHTLRPALIRLHSFSPPIITSTLRSMLPRRDLESLLRLLHVEMKNGGWSSSFDADADLSTMDASTDAPDDHAVTIIASLLSYTLDAIGAGAWLTAVGGDIDSESSEDMINALYSDTSEALNGFWEARYMRGLLGEFLRFASNLPKSHKPSAKSLERQRKPFAVSKDDGELPMLPLGSKPDMGIERMKAGKGGKKGEMSKREMGMLISKGVPKYSVEKIRI